MRLWSIHPKYLDTKGLIALWREGLLAQNVLRGKTRGYKYHPQLIRFQRTINPVGAVAEYLRHVLIEADDRGYNFNGSKIARNRYRGVIYINSGQLEYEFAHLMGKLRTRAPDQYRRLSKVRSADPHPMFDVVRGDVESWEVI